MKWIIISSFAQSQEAHYAKSLLEAEGIEVFLKDELTSQVCNHIGSAIGGIKVEVQADDADRAYRILVNAGCIKESHNNADTIEIIEGSSKKAPLHCPYCNSSHIEPSKNKHRDLNNVIMFIFCLFMPVKFKPYHCTQCHKEWRIKFNK